MQPTVCTARSGALRRTRRFLVNVPTQTGHGHNYNLYVTVKGEITHATGYLIDLKDLKVIINEYVIEKLDHKNLNMDVDFMKGKMASTRNSLH